MDSIQKQFGEVIIKHKLESEFDDIDGLPVERFINIVNVLRERHNNSRANYFVIVAAIVGAAAAVLTGALGGS